jgi:hypothetical protein
MNNQRRHQLEENALANFLEARLTKLLPLVKPAAIALMAGLVGFLVYSLYQNLTSQKSAVAWTQYYFNLDGDSDSFVELADEFGKTSAGQWSRYTAAISFLRDGIDALYVNRSEGIDLVKKSIAELEPIKNTSINELRRQALFGLAQAHESLGELDASTEYYQSLLDSDFLAEAEREAVIDRISYLGSSGAKQFYSWFNSLDPKRTAPPELSGDLGIPPDLPGIMFDPATLPGLPLQGIESAVPESEDQSGSSNITEENPTFVEDSVMFDEAESADSTATSGDSLP